MSMEPFGPDREPADDTTRAVTPLAHPTGGLPTYRKVAGYPEPEPTVPPRTFASTGQLPVTGAPVAAAPAVIRPRGPHLPSVVRGVLILAMAAFVVVWRLVDHPNWPIVGISVGIGAGVMFLLLAAISAVAHHAHGERDFDRMLPGP